jgi:hypothetical protein
VQESVLEVLVISLSMIVSHELRNGVLKRGSSEEDHSVQTLGFLERTNRSAKAFKFIWVATLIRNLGPVVAATVLTSTRTERQLFEFYSTGKSK